MTGASSVAPQADLLFLVVLAVCGAAALAITLTMAFLLLRYRHGTSVARGNVPRKKPLEIAWTLATLAIFLCFFFWGARDFVRLYRAPQDALPVDVVARQWMWKLQHRNGRREINELHVPLGQPVQLLMTSQDAIHSFYLPAFRLKQDVVPGRYTGLSFTATRLGEFQLFCSEYCGSEHSLMLGRVIVMPPAQFGQWLAQGPAQPSLAEYGFVRFRQLGCSGCHAAGSSVHAPPLEGLLGRTVHLQDGRTLVADENYVRDSILLPRKDIVAGYEPLMPSFAGQVSEEDIQALVAYLRSTAGGPGGTR